jgi:hypothetical protein
MVFRHGKKKINWQEPVRTYAKDLHKGMLIKSSSYQRETFVVTSAGYITSGTFEKKSKFFVTLRKVDRWGNMRDGLIDGWDYLNITEHSDIIILGTMAL